MASLCTTRCIDDAYVPIRATYTNLYKWPESDAAFVRSFSSNGRIEGGRDRHHHHRRHPTVVDIVSCRQLYLRSYTFTRKESMHERTKKCFDRVKEKVAKNSPCGGFGTEKKRAHGEERIGRVKEVSCAALFRAFHKLLSCTTKVDVVD